MKKYLGYTVTVLMAAFTMVGCGKNSDNGTTAVVGPYGYGSCTACGVNTQAMGTATAQNAQLGEALQLQFFGTSGATYQTYAYSGGYQQLAAQGILHIGGLAQECGLPAGDYQITTQTPGTMSGSTVQGLTMVGSGPAQVVIQFAYIYWLSPTQMQVHGYMQGSYGAQTRCEFYYQ